MNKANPNRKQGRAQLSEYRHIARGSGLGRPKPDAGIIQTTVFPRIFAVGRTWHSLCSTGAA